MTWKNLTTALQQPADRRTFLRHGFTGLVATGLALSPLGRVAEAALPERSLSFYNLHTGEELRDITFWDNGRYVTDSLRQINHLLRDFRTEQTHVIDPKLFDLLYAVRRKLPGNSPFHVISGYRCPATNAALRRHSSGVAKHSLHMAGKAIDIRLPGVELADLRHVGLQLKRGGVGYYPKSDFVHLDTGRPRFW